MGIRHVADIRENYAAGVELFEPHFPASHRRDLRRAASAAARQLEDYGKWIERNIERMEGDATSVRRTCFGSSIASTSFPWTREELMSLGEHERTGSSGPSRLRKQRTRTERVDDADNRGMDRMVSADISADQVLAEGQRSDQFPGLRRRVVPRGRGLARAVWRPRQSPRPAGLLDQGKAAEYQAQFCRPRRSLVRPTPTGNARCVSIRSTDYQHSDWPGHYFEAQVTQRHPCPIRAVHRDTGFSQGWAHYWEEFFMDMGYPFLRGREHVS